MSDNKKVRNLELEGHVGFDSLPDQMVNKTVQKGFTFNIMCIGETGIGKSTLMDSLFNTNFDTMPSSHHLKSPLLNPQTYELQENNVQMKLTIVDTVGYGDPINKESNFEAIVGYVDQQFEAYLQEELKIQRCLRTYQDTRVHACLYFICPTGKGLKPIDILCMKKLDSKVNIIPLIAKADTISKSELSTFKEKIISELKAHGVSIYQFPIVEDDDDVGEINALMNSHIPFAVVGSTKFATVGNNLVRARQYPWGIVQVENGTHCDFVKLRDMLIRTNMEDLRESTHTKHYELYRKTRLEKMGFSDVDSDNKPSSFLQTCENKMRKLQQELAETEKERNRQLNERFKIKEAKFDEKEYELEAKFAQIREETAKEIKRSEDYQKQLDYEIAEFQRLKIQHQTGTLSRPCSKRHTLSLGSLKNKKI